MCADSSNSAKSEAGASSPAPNAPSGVNTPEVRQSPAGQMGASERSPEPISHVADRELVDRVAAKEARRIRARQREKSIWFGLGMFGMIGWSVAVPTVAAIALGVWIDRRWPSPYSWTLMLLFVGVVLGCVNAWYWVTRERRLIEAELAEEIDGDKDGRRMGR